MIDSPDEMIDNSPDEMIDNSPDEMIDNSPDEMIDSPDEMVEESTYQVIDKSINQAMDEVIDQMIGDVVNTNSDFQLDEAVNAIPEVDNYPGNDDYISPHMIKDRFSPRETASYDNQPLQSCSLDRHHHRHRTSKQTIVVRNGKNGRNGKDGRGGRDGDPGPPGPPGPPGCIWCSLVIPSGKSEQLRLTTSTQNNLGIDINPDMVMICSAPLHPRLGRKETLILGSDTRSNNQISRKSVQQTHPLDPTAVRLLAATGGQLTISNPTDVAYRVSYAILPSV